jgi:ATP-dependent Clp protease ATP-binding subunit ClpA
MTDGQGRTVDFKNTILIMTSNLGSQLIMDLGWAGTCWGGRKGKAFALTGPKLMIKFLKSLEN